MTQVGLVLLLSSVATNVGSKGGFDLVSWEGGFALRPRGHQDRTMYLWFYEWHMFDAVLPGQHTHSENGYRPATVTHAGQSATIESATPGIHLDVKATADGAEMTLTVKNESQQDWPALAAIIPCFNPGGPDWPNRTTQFLNQQSYFPAQEGLKPLAMEA